MRKELSVNNKAKVAFFITHPIQYLSPLFRELNKNNQIELTVYYFSDETVKSFKDKDLGVIEWDTDLLSGYKSKFIKNNSPTPTVNKMPFGLMNWGVIKELKENNYDFILVQGWNYISHWVVFFTSFSLKIPVLLRVEMPLNQELLKSKWKLLLKKILLTPLFKRVSGFLAIGKQNANFFKSYGISDTKIVFSPYAVDNDFYRSNYVELRGKKEELKRKCKLSKYGNIVLFVGKLINKKRPLDLIKAFQLAEQQDSCLVLVGEGDLRNSLEKYIKINDIKNIFFTGFINQNELPVFYTMADLFVLPSGLGETWGLVLNEAMNYDLPIVVSETVGSCDDLVLDNGVTFKEGDIQELSCKIKNLLSDGNLLNMGKRSYQVIQKYSYEHIEESILEIINKVTAIK